jgi:uncharacterized membrane protein YdjX (TVP38/TMEM64 family)
MTDRRLHFMTWVHGLGWPGGLLLMAVYALCCVTLLPGSVLTLGAGAIYGLFPGTALISMGSLLGATTSFLASRYLLRGWLTKKLSGNKKFIQLDTAVGREGWKIVILSRLSPIFPFSLLNYGLGLTRISVGQFMLASWLGTLPLNIVYVYAGSVVGDLAHLGAAGAHKPKGLWILQIVGLIATITLVVFTTRLATRTLQKKIAD